MADKMTGLAEAEIAGEAEEKGATAADGRERTSLSFKARARRVRRKIEATRRRQ